MKQNVKARLHRMLQLMQEHRMQYYMITTADYHHSEYVGDYFKFREYVSGFTGSNGDLLVGEESGLWTDGRYFIQAQKELEGSGITLFRMGEENVPEITEYIKAHLKEGKALGFDGRTVNVLTGKKLEKIAEEKKASLIYDIDLSEPVWEDRPALLAQPILLLDEEICGLTVAEKLSEIRKEMEKEECGMLVLNKLDDIMWLFNIRGGDIPCNPVAMSYAVVTMQEAWLFLQPESVSREVRQWESRQPVTIQEYDKIQSFLGKYHVSGKVWLDERQMSFSLYKLILSKAEVLLKENPTELKKAMKNEEELRQIREVYKKDSLAVCRFMRWIKENAGKIPITECSAAEYMDDLRRRTEGFLDLSFPTISGYQENAAMMHYKATPENQKEIRAEGMLLVDSGGQYLGGTTDVTRTFALGPVTEEMKTHFTAVAMGMLQLMDARFLHGCSGKNLDILAREPLWNMGIDYKCGTGHGIGYILNVHEGPQRIIWKYAPGAQEAALEEGMLVSNEPGVYIEGSHGIRTENIMAVKKDVKNSDGQFLSFECLTFVPIDPDLIDVSLLDGRDRERLNRYHQQVYEIIGPMMEEEERDWLRSVTRPV